MKTLFLSFSVLTFWSQTAACGTFSDTLITPNYEVTITSHCTEGNVSCDNVTYVGKNKKTGQSLTLKGATLYTMCSDGLSPCAFDGYAFHLRDINFQVLMPNELLVTRHNKVIIEERGEWRSERNSTAQ